MATGDYLLVRRRTTGFTFLYSRQAGSQYGARDLTLHERESPKTRGQFRFLVKTLATAAKAGYRIGLLGRSSLDDNVGTISHKLYLDGKGPP